MRKIISILLFGIVLIGLGCGISTSVLCVSSRIGNTYYIGQSGQDSTKGLWLVKHVYRGDSLKKVVPEADWVLIFKDIELIGYDNNFIIGARTSHNKKFVHIQRNLNGHDKIKFFNDSLKFVDYRKKTLTPNTIEFSRVNILSNSPCYTDTLGMK
ncbi:MAG TPA: hypothetical protein VK658_01825 [Chryseolinea sp.]|nr:hypothetical protein [Chryseolinea sp.]